MLDEFGTKGNFYGTSFLSRNQIPVDEKVILKYQRADFLSKDRLGTNILSGLLLMTPQALPIGS